MNCVRLETLRQMPVAERGAHRRLPLLIFEARTLLAATAENQCVGDAEVADAPASRIAPGCLQ